ncbi:glycosyltransferase family 9 protein [Rubellicoccus peritrichatus]|uniref:Glycosyltransferase family 9 protein n=1 Tax=Rubellicoccus peritrichatus TaxID=3080537 RepID=A0AAQ3L8L1_9BACT|nr:glycosyltransferase family 9 protein [Puniceicoccus sp. CR14]WOO39682.1 glycosyltransferase family 9 protein [Puniceicoccus sp. CR14]
MRDSSPTFFDQVRNSKKILVLDLGFLGDTIHLVPALWAIREALPDAKIDAMVGDHIKDILRLTPWLDEVLGYPRFPTSPGLGWHISFIKELRSRKYDAVINLNGSDRSSFLTLLSGASLRLGRFPPKIPWYWKYLFTEYVFAPFDRPVFKQRWDCLKSCGFPVDEPQFAAQIPEDIEKKVADLVDGESGFIHISPFTTQDTKELPISVLAEMIDLMHGRFPAKKVVVSCAPNDRERGKLKQLLSALSGPRPWRVFDGNLLLVELAGVISKAVIHLGGDSGALHVALMVDRPTVSWWRDYPGIDEWKPQGEDHAALIGVETENGVASITAPALLVEASRLIEQTSQ